MDSRDTHDGSAFPDVLALVAMAVLLAGCAFLLWSAQALVVAGIWEDIFLPWGAGARWQDGQIPSLDFPSALGPAYFALHGLGFEMSGGAATSVLKANVIALALTLPVMALVLFSRLPPLVAGAAMLCFGLWMISPRQADLGSKLLTHLASYNRHGLVWSALVIIAAALPWRMAAGASKRLSWRHLLDGILVGLLLLACVFTKATFALLAGVFFGLAILWRYRGRWDIVAACYGAAGLTIVTGLAALELRVPGLITAYLGDLSYAASIQETGLFRNVISNRGEAFMFLFLEALMSAVAIGAILTRTGLRAAAGPALLAGAALVTLVAIMGQVHDIYAPVLAVSTLIFAGAALPRIDTSGRTDRRVLSLAVLPVLLIPVAIESAGIAQHTLYAARVARDPQAYLGFPDRGLFLSEGQQPLPATLPGAAEAVRSSLEPVRAGRMTAEDWNATGRLGAVEFHEIWADLRALLDDVAGPDDRIFCFAFTNGCPVLTGTAPPAGLLPWWHAGRSYDPASPPADALATATLIAIPRVDRFGYGTAIRDAYADDLDAQFDPVAASPFWTVLRRTGTKG